MKWWTALPALALACNLSVEGTNADDPVEEMTSGTTDGETGDDGCGAIHDEDECVAAGCAPLVARPVVVGAGTDAPTCEYGEPVVICTPPEETEECEDARACGDEQYAWAMPMPDGGALVALVELSCGLPEGFLPCPEPGDTSAGGTGTGASSSSTDGGDGGSEDPLALACDCACS